MKFMVWMVWMVWMVLTMISISTNAVERKSVLGTISKVQIIAENTLPYTDCPSATNEEPLPNCEQAVALIYID